jgi:hypothetical protein
VRWPQDADVRRSVRLELRGPVAAVVDLPGIDRGDHDERWVASKFLFGAETKQFGAQGPLRIGVCIIGQRYRPGSVPSAAWTATKCGTEQPRSDTDSDHLNASCGIERRGSNLREEIR